MAAKHEPDHHTTFLRAAERVLREADEPLHYREITRRCLERGLIVTAAKMPEISLNAQIAVRLKTRGESSIFVRTAPGMYGLREWLGKRKLEALNEEGARVFIVYYPVYEWSRAVLPSWVGEPPGEVTGMGAAINETRGTPQEPLDWTEPDQWIQERLTGEPRRLALKTWLESGRKVNPRYFQPHWQLASRHKLLDEDAEGRLVLTARGRSFVDEPGGTVEQEIDEEEGVLKLLSLVAELGPANRSDLLEPFGEFLRSQSRLRSDHALEAAQWARLRNLQDRRLVERSGFAYTVTPAGLDYLQRLGGQVEPTPEQQIRRLLAEQKERVQSEIHELLLEMDPFAFEQLIKRLLEKMGYEEVDVTARSGDKGVDVVGHIELGITSVREVIQAKRHRGSIGRGVLDQLRGVLHRFQAVRGTIITTGRFTSGTQSAAFEPGAAPITLIDGERLVELLIEHELGVTKRKAEIWEVDVDDFAGLLPGEEEGAGA